MKTTILLRDDLHGLLVHMFGKKNISKGINEIVYEHLVKEKKAEGMFGADSWLQKTSLKDVRDHREHDL